jgi:FAD/FMN-containing dehydrogenase
VSDVQLNALESLIADLGDIPVITESKVVRRRSRDFFWYSPILNEQLDGKSADLIVAPRNEADVIRTAAVCARYRVPITACCSTSRLWTISSGSNLGCFASAQAPR